MPFNRPIASLSFRALCLLSAAIPLCAGCSTSLWNAFLDPSQPGNYYTHEIVEIQKSISFYDPPLGVPGAEEPKPQDLVAIVEEYRIGPSDALSIRLLDFLQLGAETDLTPLTVDELGYINVPQLGLVQAEGLSAYELQQDLIARAKLAGIYNPEDEPTVTVAVISAQHRTFNISGAIANPGLYPIVRPDFRLREAINLAGGLDPSVKDVYVLRNPPREKLVRERRKAPPAAEPAGPAVLPEDLPPAPPVAPMSPTNMSGASGPAPRTVAAAQPSGRLAVPPEEAEQELIEALTPEETTVPATTPAEALPATSPANGTQGSHWIYINDQFIEVPATQPGGSPPGEPPVAPPPPKPEAPAPEPPAPEAPPVVDWEELADEGQQRIIHIDVKKLRNGDPSCNIVIRHDDFIRLDPGPVGAFYLSGHVVRPGAYNFVGEQITLRRAIASAGGLDPLAWPSRASITRRIDENREEILQLDLARIMEGKDPDFYLKPNDLIDVGTHAIAPLLATIRNSFRLTYGFGFVYDRNFADIDAYIPQQNPRDVRRFTLQQRFPGLFP